MKTFQKLVCNVGMYSIFIQLELGENLRRAIWVILLIKATVFAHRSACVWACVHACMSVCVCVCFLQCKHMLSSICRLIETVSFPVQSANQPAGLPVPLCSRGEAGAGLPHTPDRKNPWIRYVHIHTHTHTVGQTMTWPHISTQTHSQSPLLSLSFRLGPQALFFSIPPFTPFSLCPSFSWPSTSASH